MRVRFAVLSPDVIFNLTSPRYLPEIALHWTGHKPWHDPHYDPLRNRMETAYIELFDAECGHFSRLLESVEREGFRNPVMISGGKLQMRLPAEVPPGAARLVCEYVGGSRIWAAAKLGMDVPAIINDHAGLLPDAEVLTDWSRIKAKFADLPAQMRRGIDGSVYLNYLPFAHMPKGYQMAEQCQIRRRVVAGVADMVGEWLEKFDG